MTTTLTLTLTLTLLLKEIPPPPDPNEKENKDKSEDGDDDDALEEVEERDTKKIEMKRKEEEDKLASAMDRLLHSEKGTHEGVAILSKLGIKSKDSRKLSILSDWSNDDNKRSLLRVTVKAPNLGPVHFIVAHFSYDDVQQCTNVAALRHFLGSVKVGACPFPAPYCFIVMIFFYPQILIEGGRADYPPRRLQYILRF